MAKVPSGGINIIVEGLIARVRADVDHARRHVDARARSRRCRRQSERTLEVDAYVRRIQELIERALSLATGLSQELRGVVAGIDDPLRLAYLLASLLDMKADGQAAAAREPTACSTKLEAVATRADARDRRCSSSRARSSRRRSRR